jgi:ABC-type bacteriocin/lantibiotic exporter with double-glycine peptidase domain
MKAAIRQNLPIAGIVIFFFAMGLLVVVTDVILLAKKGPDANSNRVAGKFLGRDGVVMQDKSNNCGPSALKMIFDYFEIPVAVDELEHSVGLRSKGSSMLALKEVAESKGLRAEGWNLTFSDVARSTLPAIVFVHNNHFAVVDSVVERDFVYLRDPTFGRVRLSAAEFRRVWKGETLILRKQIN